MSYPGSKGQSGTWQRIIGNMPPHSIYVEAFCGEATIFWKKLRADNNILLDTNPKVIAAVNAKLGGVAGVRAVVGDAIRMLPDLFTWLPKDAVVYCDPPYMLGTRTKQLLYAFDRQCARDELSDGDHATLLAVLLQAKCNVLISGYPHDLYSSHLRKWRCIEYTTMTRGGKRRECLWCNFPEPVELHDWRFAGFNYRERFGMNRFVKRWLDRLNKMPPRKAGYVKHELAKALGGNDPQRSITTPLALMAMTSTSAKAGATR